MTNSMKAPKYFLELIKKSNKVDAKIAKLIGVAPKWLREKREGQKAEIEEVREVMKKLIDKPKEGRLLGSLLDICSGYRDIAWAEFRYANIDNRFGGADHLRFDPIKKTINIRKISKSGLHSALKKY